MKNMLASIDGLSRREKLILLSILLAVSLIILLELVWTPRWTELHLLQNNHGNAGKLHESLRTQHRVLESKLAKDPNVSLRTENTKLAMQLAASRQQLKDGLSRLVAPEDMPALLTELLAALPELEVREVIKLPARKLQQGEGEDAAMLFSHRVRITVAGEYFDAVRYIRQIETEPSRLRLVSLDYTVEDYPLALMVLEIETLGLEARWLGV